MNIKKLDENRFFKNPMLKQSLSTAVSIRSSKNGPDRLSTVKNIIEWKYIPKTVVESDIVMLKLKTPLTLNDYVQKICLPPPEFKADRSVVRSDQTKSPVCLITGWGRTQTTRSAEALQQASIPVNCHPIS